MTTEYIVINGDTWPVNTLAECEAAAAALAAAGQDRADVWVTPHTLEWIEANEDPDAYKNGQVLFAKGRP